MIRKRISLSLRQDTRRTRSPLWPMMAGFSRYQMSIKSSGPARSFAHRDSRGVVTVFTALLLPVLIGFAGLAIDAGYLYVVKRKLQSVSDAVALACTRQMQRGMSCDASNPEVLDIQTLYGVPWSAVTLTTPATNQVRASVSENAPTFFMKVLGFSTVPVSASATAEFRPTCIYTLAATGSNALLTGTAANVQMPNCGAFVHSADDAAVNIIAGSTFNASYIDIVGKKIGSGSLTPSVPMQEVSAMGDPLADLPVPTVPSGCDYVNYTNSGNLDVTLNPGVYCGGITIRLKPVVTFNPGVYYLVGGGLQSGAGYSSFIGTGVTFYNTYNGTYPYAPIVIGGNGPLFQLSAPTSGPLKGILFFQDRTATGSANIFGGGTVAQIRMSGVLYFKTTAVTFNGGSAVLGAPYTTIVANNVTFNGLSRINFQAGTAWSPVSGPVRLIQ